MMSLFIGLVTQSSGKHTLVVNTASGSSVVIETPEASSSNATIPNGQTPGVLTESKASKTTFGLLMDAPLFVIFV